MSLGYGAGGAKFREICRQKGVDITEERAKEIVGLWREVYSAIPANWRQQDKALRAMHLGALAGVGAGNYPNTMTGALVWTWTGDGECGFEMVTGHRIRYADLKEDSDGWSYHTNRGRKRLWGGTCDENLCQHLARTVIAEQWLMFDLWLKRTHPRWSIVLQVHDELVAVGPEDEAPEVAQALERILSTSPTWWPDLPLAAETGYAQRYGLAKS